MWWQSGGMNKKTLPPPPDFDSPEEAKDIISFLWNKLAELEDRLNQNSRNSSVPSSQQPLHNKAKKILRRIGRSLEKSKGLNQVIKVIADCFIQLKTVPRLSNIYQIKHATAVVALFPIESLLNDIKFLIYLTSHTHLLSIKPSKVSAHGVVISIKPSFQNTCLIFRWDQIYTALSQSKRHSIIKA